MTLSIAVDERSFQVTKNLQEALQCLSLVDKPRWLWIDALSIDQFNIEERSFQLRGMAGIYKNAERVLIWLGLGNPGILSALKRLNEENDYRIRIARELEHLRDLRLGTSTWQREERTGTHRQIYDSNESESDDAELPILPRPLMGQSEASDEEILAIDSIFEHPWWGRVWVIQEATLAKNLLVVCDRETLPWSLLCQIYPTSMRSPWGVSAIRASANEQKLEPLRRLNSIRREWRVVLDPPNKLSAFRILDLIELFRFSKATDPRDKIYALVGLAQDGSKIDLNYSATTQDVYTKITKLALEGILPSREISLSYRAASASSFPI